MKLTGSGFLVVRRSKDAWTAPCARFDCSQVVAATTYWRSSTRNLQCFEQLALSGTAAVGLPSLAFAQLFHYAAGPLIAQLSTDNHNEWPAIWCLLSIGILILVIKTPLRGWLHVNRWILWPGYWSALAAPADRRKLT